MRGGLVCSSSEAVQWEETVRLSFPLYEVELWKKHGDATVFSWTNCCGVIKSIRHRNWPVKSVAVSVGSKNGDSGCKRPSLQIPTASVLSHEHIMPPITALDSRVEDRIVEMREE